MHRITASLTKAIGHPVHKNSQLALWQNGCFGQFHHSRIKVFQIAKVFAEADLRPELNSEGLKKHKSFTIILLMLFKAMFKRQLLPAPLVESLVFRYWGKMGCCSAIGTLSFSAAQFSTVGGTL